MGRDEHKKSRGKRILSQTPKQQLSDGIDIEYSDELADQADIKSQARSHKADQRTKRDK